MSSHEQPPANDQGIIDEIVKFGGNLQRQTTPALRGQHPKMHACLHGEFRVLDELPKNVAVGVFAEPRSFPVWIRYSNGFGTDDRQPDLHGMAIKLMGVPGDKLGQEKESQDFVLMDTPCFFAGDVETLLRFIEQKVALMSQGKTEPEQFQALSVNFPNEVRRFLEMAGPTAAPPSNSRYWSCGASLLGDQAVQYMIEPQGFDSEPSTALEIPDSENYGIKLLTESFITRAEDLVFNFHIQKQIDPETEPVENASVEWKGPYTRVAELTIPAQDFTDPDVVELGDLLSFNPWHSLPEHRPLGGLNRSRKPAYEQSSQIRHETLGAPMIEPRPGDTPKSVLKNIDRK